jgi:hypothetical protein
MHLPHIFKSNVLLIFLFILLAVFYSGCGSDFTISPTNPAVTPTSNPIRPTSGSITIEAGAEITSDCTPSLTIYSGNAKYMSFSGDGENWTDWIEYDNSYEEFNIANGMNGTDLSSGIKYVYVHFKGEEGNLSPSDELAYDSIEYELGELYSIKISPQEVTIPLGSSYIFTLQGYDYGSKNEVPLDSAKVTWTKPCGVGSLSPIIGLSTTYTAPSILGKRNITAQYNNLKTGAVVIVVEDE